MRELRLCEQPARKLPPLRRNDLIWLRRTIGIILILTAMWLILSAAVGLASPFVAFR